MKSEKLAQAQNTISTGEALNTSMKAEADRKVVEIVSEGKRQSEVIRGEGEAERASTFAAAFQKDPEFYAFYRSMQAYDKSLSSGGTNLVLSPNSEFFRYFGGQKDDAQVSAPKP
jgi:modulator of FtsH protease HflC